MPRLLCFGIISYCLLRGVSFGQSLGVDDYVTGMTVIGKPGAGTDCPPIVWLIEPNTPAAKAGIKPGDRLLVIDGKPVADVAQARPLLRSSEAKSSTIELEGERGTYTITVDRILNSSLYERNGWKRGPDGSLYPKDATLAEMQRISKMHGEPAIKVFVVGHYPANQDLYYPGFEIFVWPEPQAMTVGGIEEGPAKAAGVHYGDPIVSVNGVNPHGKSGAELEQLFSSPAPATMTLVIDRDGQTKTFTFQLAKASDVAAANHKRLYKGRMIPSVIPMPYLHCFEPVAR
jgi:membrane-associated protease RseP (regulator of RpoE activity)